MLIFNFYFPRIIEGEFLSNLQFGTKGQIFMAQEIQHFGRLIADIGYSCRPVEVQVEKIDIQAVCKLPLTVGNWIAVRIRPWKTQVFIQPVEFFFCCVNLKLLLYKM